MGRIHLVPEETDRLLHQGVGDFSEAVAAAENVHADELVLLGEALCHRFGAAHMGQVPPATQYSPSPHPYPQRVDDLQYPPFSEVRRVRSNGQIKWRGELVFVREALVGELVGVAERQAHWLVSFGPIPLGRLRPHQKALERLSQGPPT